MFWLSLKETQRGSEGEEEDEEDEVTDASVGFMTTSPTNPLVLATGERTSFVIAMVGSDDKKKVERGVFPLYLANIPTVLAQR